LGAEGREIDDGRDKDKEGVEHETESEVEKVFVVPDADARSQPYAMVIRFPKAGIAPRTVHNLMRWSVNLASDAELQGTETIA